MGGGNFVENFLALLATIKVISHLNDLQVFQKSSDYSTPTFCKYFGGAKSSIVTYRYLTEATNVVIHPKCIEIL